jgi:hypothetical protein
MAKKKDDHWMEKIHKGGLHKSLGIAEGKKIPQKRIVKAEHSHNQLERKQAKLAETFKKERPKK